MTPAELLGHQDDRRQQRFDPTPADGIIIVLLKSVCSWGVWHITYWLGVRVILLVSRELHRDYPRANASNVLYLRGSGQDFREEIWVQGCGFALAGDAVLARVPLE